MVASVHAAITPAHSGTTAVSSQSVTMPTGITAGMVGYLYVATHNTARTLNALSGWTVATPGTFQNQTSMRSWVLKRTMDGSESGTTVTPTLSGTGIMYVGGVVIKDADPATEVITNGVDTVADLVNESLAITPTANDSLLVQLQGVRYTVLTGTPAGTAPTGFTEQVDAQNGVASGTNGRLGIYISTKALSGQAGVSQTAVNGTWAVTAVENTWMVALGPAAAAQLPASGTVAATSAVSASSALRAIVSGVAVATTAVAGAASGLLGVSGSAPAVSAVSGSASVISAASGTVAATSTATAAAVRTAPATGSVAATTTAVGAATSRQAAAGSVAGVSGVSGSANVIGGTQQLPASGTVAANSAASGAATLRAATSGTVAATSAISGAATLRAATTGTVAATSSVTAAPKLRAAASGSLAATSAITGSARLLAPAGGIVAALSDTTGEAFATYAVSGAVEATSGTNGSADNLGDPVDIVVIVITENQRRVAMTVHEANPTEVVVNPRTVTFQEHTRPVTFREAAQ